MGEGIQDVTDAGKDNLGGGDPGGEGLDGGGGLDGDDDVGAANLKRDGWGEDGLRLRLRED